jgi:EAL domain-containing protein (putative c-di-GMP-specific phosphodiesterase class I)
MPEWARATISSRPSPSANRHISIDDFGTAYSSLSYLKRFTIDMLKFDQSFVHGITTDPDDTAIVSAIIAMSHSLGIKAIAEGVETDAQLSFLCQRGCDAIQGYRLRRPLPGDEFENFLRLAPQRPLSNCCWSHRSTAGHACVIPISHAFRMLHG